METSTVRWSLISMVTWQNVRSSTHSATPARPTCAVGLDYEPHGVAVTRANLELARERGHVHDAEVVHGDARQLPHLLPAGTAGRSRSW
ncbi:hypothetical protein F9C11_17520 [Amycolatopsis sp. VS8301801F10]